MENSYGIGVTNRYELFYNDEMDPLDVLAKEKKAIRGSEKENKIADKKSAKSNISSKKSSGIDDSDKKNDVSGKFFLKFLVDMV